MSKPAHDSFITIKKTIYSDETHTADIRKFKTDQLFIQ